MLIRQKITNLNDEYHHVDPVGMFGVLTDASGNVLRNYVYDAFSDAPYKRQYVGESFPSQSNHTGTCQTALSEPGILTGSGGRGVVVPSRGFQVMGKKPGPVKKQPCKKPPRGPYTVPNCLQKDSTCESDANYQLAACIAATALGTGAGVFICGVVCAGAETGVLTVPCIWCLRTLGGGAVAAIGACFTVYRNQINACNVSNNRCINTGYWY
jgi:hypothetical protein